MGEFNLITKEVIFDSFQKVIKKKDKVVLLYSGLWSLINKLEFKKNIGKNFLNILEEIVGKKKTLVLPSFSGTSFIKNKVFNIRKSLDNKNGLLSKEALHRSYYYRTPQPIHSYLVFGDGKKEIECVIELSVLINLINILAIRGRSLTIIFSILLYGSITVFSSDIFSFTNILDSKPFFMRALWIRFAARAAPPPISELFKCKIFMLFLVYTLF